MAVVFVVSGMDTTTGKKTSVNVEASDGILAVDEARRMNLIPCRIRLTSSDGVKMQDFDVAPDGRFNPHPSFLDRFPIIVIATGVVVGALAASVVVNVLFSK